MQRRVYSSAEGVWLACRRIWGLSTCLASVNSSTDTPKASISPRVSAMSRMAGSSSRAGTVTFTE